MPTFSGLFRPRRRSSSPPVQQPLKHTALSPNPTTSNSFATQQTTPPRHAGSLDDLRDSLVAGAQERGWGPRVPRDETDAKGQGHCRTTMSRSESSSPPKQPLLYAKPWHAKTSSLSSSAVGASVGSPPQTAPFYQALPSSYRPHGSNESTSSLAPPLPPPRFPSVSTITSYSRDPVGMPEPTPYQAPPKADSVYFPGGFTTGGNGTAHQPVQLLTPPRKWSTSNPSQSLLATSTDSRPRPPRPASDPSPQKATPQAQGASNSPNGKKGPQCAGITAAGKRCTRRAVDDDSDNLDDLLKLSRLNLNDDDSDSGSDDVGAPRFCHQHGKAIGKDRGTFLKSGKWIEFEDWVPQSLPTATQLQLRVELTKPVSNADGPGYIYCHEMTPKKGSQNTNNKLTLIKVGRSVKPVARLAQWKGQCPSREPIVRGFFPKNNSSTVSGAVGVGTPGPYHHRWERLILTEMAGICSQLDSNSGFGKKKECPDCSRTHQELFVLPAGSYEKFVKEVIERWLGFVNLL